MDYVVLDLEWNQGNGTSEQEVPGIPFEIVEIGAVKLNDGRGAAESGARVEWVGEFSQLIRPSVYHEMNQVTGRLIHLRMKELKKGKPFPESAESFLRWCGEEYCFCTCPLERKYH